MVTSKKAPQSAPKDTPTPAQPIAVDAMGAENGTAEVVRAVQLALAEIQDIGPIVLVGKPRLISSLLRKVGLDKDPRITIHPASEIITMEDKPVEAMKRKKDASMLRAVELVRDGACGAMVSCGNTGALMASGTIRLRPMPGVERPSLAPTMPTPNQHFVLLDAGANPVAKPVHLVHQAILGSNYAKVILGEKHKTRNVAETKLNSLRGCARPISSPKWSANFLSSKA